MNQRALIGLFSAWLLLGCSSNGGSNSDAAGASGHSGASQETGGSSSGTDGGADAGSVGGAVSGDAGDGGAVTPPPASTIAVTSLGVVVGEPTQMMVPTTGGTVTSADGRLKIEVPAGALAADQMITVQPITNQSPGGLGVAYRLGPEGLTFAIPATLTFSYNSVDISGSELLALNVAYQDAKGQWNSINSITRDDTATTVSVTTSHFSDWSMLLGWQLTPAMAMVQTTGTVNFTINYCRGEDVGEDLVMLRDDCATDSYWFTVQGWQVNGVPNGNSALGTVEDLMGGATYTAPGTAPATDPVAVSATATLNGRKTVLVSNVWIDAHPQLKGTITTTQSDGPTNVTVTTSAEASFVWDPTVGYVSTEGSLNANWDVVSDICQSHMTASAPILMNDAQILFGDDGSYFPGAATMATYNGTTTCGTGGVPSPSTLTDNVEWWPAPAAPLLIKSDGRMEEALPETQIGERMISMHWSLLPQPKL